MTYDEEDHADEATRTNSQDPKGVNHYLFALGS